MNVSEHIGLAHTLARQWSGDGEYDDLVQEACMVMLRCAESFNPDVGVEWSTYAGRAIRNRFHRLYVLKQRNDAVSDLADVSAPPEPMPLTFGVDLSVLDEGAAAVIRMKYEQSMSCADIGRRLGLTRSRIQQIECAALELLRSYMTAA